jgi:hypothetical protein
VIERAPRVLLSTQFSPFAVFLTRTRAAKGAGCLGRPSHQRYPSPRTLGRAYGAIPRSRLGNSPRSDGDFVRAQYIACCGRYFSAFIVGINTSKEGLRSMQPIWDDAVAPDELFALGRAEPLT